MGSKDKVNYCWQRQQQGGEKREGVFHGLML
jgi:hypothetical protein